MRAALLLPLLTVLALAQSPTKPSCKSFRFDVSLSAGHDFEKAVGEGLTLTFKQQNEYGWEISMFKHGLDYIYPVNLPIRFNPLQIVGPGYGQTLRDQTSNRTMKFLWKDDEFENISSLEQNVLWPYQTKNPDKAVDEYTRAINAASVGELRLKVRRFKAEKDRLIAIDYEAEIVVPEAFQTLVPTRAAMCPVLKI